MKLMRIGYLGQTEVPVVPIIDTWNDISTYCRTKATDEQCVALLGTNPLYLPPTCKPETPFWAWMLLGFAISRITNI
jgi:hypothetical protein